MVSPPCYACWSWLCSDQCLPGFLISDCSPSTQIGISRLFFELCRIPHEESEWEYDLFATFMMTHIFFLPKFWLSGPKMENRNASFAEFSRNSHGRIFHLAHFEACFKKGIYDGKVHQNGRFPPHSAPKNQILDTPNCFPVDSITPTTAFRDYSCKECCCGFFSSKHIYIHLQLSGVDHALKSMSSTCIQESGYIRKSWSLSDRNYLHLPNFLLASIKLLFLLRGMCTETRSENGASHSHLLKIITFHTQVFKQSSIVDLKNDGSTFSYYTPKF